MQRAVRKQKTTNKRQGSSFLWYFVIGRRTTKPSENTPPPKKTTRYAAPRFLPNIINTGPPYLIYARKETGATTPNPPYLCSAPKEIRGEWSNDQSEQQMSTPPPPPCPPPCHHNNQESIRCTNAGNERGVLPSVSEQSIVQCSQYP